jgi:putative ATPase
LLADLGYGKDYRYVHDFPDHFVRENYLPDELKSRIYYQPTHQGDENRIAKYLKKLWLNLKAYKG